MAGDCLILGDCIAQGLAGALKGCLVAAKVGVSSATITSMAPLQTVDVAYISSGTNNYKSSVESIVTELERTRKRVYATRIVWILPIPEAPRAAVKRVAIAHNDQIVSFIGGVGGFQSRVHPASYRALANSIMRSK